MTTVLKTGGVQTHPKTNSGWVLSRFSVPLLPNPEIQDDGPLPEMERLAQKLEEARDSYGGCGRSWPKSREESDAQTELAHQRIRPALLEWIDAGVSPAVIERMLFYFWFRTTAINRDLKEFCFQKLERNWDVVMAHVNQNLDEQAAADRQRQ
jgi:hypothetical protein